MARTVCWFSCGAASAVATKMTLRESPEAIVAYCETGSEHPDNERFLADCVRWFNAPIARVRSEEYSDTFDVWRKRRYLSGTKGAPCTVALKVEPRLSFQRPDDIHVFGYTADANDIARAKRLRETYFEMRIETPLIDAGLTKQACLALIDRAGIALPPMYALGFQNNNCIPCVKATSPGYWALVRKHFPGKFDAVAELAREVGCRLARIDNERVFIDEIPLDWPSSDPVSVSCDFLCHLAGMKMEKTV